MDQINNIRILTPRELKKDYPNYFKSIFGTEPSKQIPKTVIVHEVDNKIKGFISGYRIDKETFYISWGGTTGNFVGSKKFWFEGEKIIKEHGIKWLHTNVHNIDTVCQRMLMGIGWVPFGLKIAKGKIFVEYFKEL